MLSSNRALRSLILNDNLIESEGAITLLESATSNRESRLRVLSLKRNLLSDTRLERLVQLLNARSALTRFEIAGNPVAGHQLFRQVRNTLEVT